MERKDGLDDLRASVMMALTKNVIYLSIVSTRAVVTVPFKTSTDSAGFRYYHSYCIYLFVNILRVF